MECIQSIFLSKLIYLVLMLAVVTLLLRSCDILVIYIINMEDLQVKLIALQMAYVVLPLHLYDNLPH